MPKHNDRELVLDSVSKKFLFEPVDKNRDSESINIMFNTILVDFLWSCNEKARFLTCESKRAIRAATLMRDRVNQDALKNLVQLHFKSKIRDLHTLEIWDQLKFATHFYEPMVLPKEYAELHVDF